MEIRELSSFIHSIKEPVYSLDAIINYGTTIAKDEEMARVLSLAKDNVNYLKRITGSFNAIVKNESSMYEINYSSMNVKEFINLYADRISPYLKENNITLETEVDADDFITDFDVVTRILNDLVGNSVKYNDKQEKYIKIIAKGDKKNMCFAVEDNGIGIPKDEISRVTDIMYRGSNGAKLTTNGSGLGLKLVAGFIDALEGELNIKSKVNVGTTISFKLPAGKVTSLAGADAELEYLSKDALDIAFSVCVEL